jgi:hypothetical protein
MKRFALVLGVTLLFVPRNYAQEFEHIQLGAYADYFRSNQTGTNMAGLGGRAGFPLLSHLKLEGEMSYDFNQVFNEGFTSTSGGTVTFRNTGTRTLHGLFGPKLEVGHSGVRPFLEVKGGFVNYQFDSRPASLDTFISSVGNLRSQNMNGVVMPGGGVEGRLGPVGLRLDVGDEMYFNHGAHHNLKVMFGPFLRF